MRVNAVAYKVVLVEGVICRVSRTTERERFLFQLATIHLTSLRSIMTTPTLARSLLRHSTRSAINPVRVCGKKSFTSISSSIQSSSNRSSTLSARPRFANASSSPSVFGELSLSSHQSVRRRVLLTSSFPNSLKSFSISTTTNHVHSNGDYSQYRFIEVHPRSSRLAYRNPRIPRCRFRILLSPRRPTLPPPRRQIRLFRTRFHFSEQDGSFELDRIETRDLFDYYGTFQCWTNAV